MQNTYMIPIQYFDLMNQRLKKLNKKAEKLNLEPIKVKILDTVMYEIDDEGTEIPSYKVEIEQEEEIVINGYRFMGKLEKNVGDTYIYKGEEGVPKEQKKIIACQHCNTNRKRKFYYVLKNENTGEFINVGKSCLKDFTGHMDADRIASFYQDIKMFIEENCEDLYESYCGYGFEPTVYSIDQVIRASIISIKERGYYKSDTEDEMPTKSHVENIMMSAFRKTTKDESKAYEESLKIPKEDIDEMKMIVSNLNPRTDFIENLQLLVKDGFVKETMLGYAVYIPMIVEKEKERKLKEELRKKANSESDYVGEVGEKITREVYYSRFTSFDSFFGNRWVVTYMYIFLDMDNNCIVWKTQKAEDFEVGDLIEISGKVKEHSEYKGLKQTFVTRPKIKILEKSKQS